MAVLILDTKKLKSNFDYLDAQFKKKNIEWSIVTKMLCGNKLFLSELLKFDCMQVCDSRVSNIREIKTINPNIEVIYIRPPAKRMIPSIVKYADISMNTEIETIRLLSEEAKKQNKVHKVIIMIELGELREGVLGENVINFYENVFNLENIQVVGIGANLSCLYGILPNQDKLVQLCLFKQLIEAKFNKKIRYISGGSSVTIPMMLKNVLPKGINHFRVGETLFLGTNVYDNTKLKKMNSDVFRLYAQIVELKEKPMVPTGETGHNLEGKTFEFDQTNLGKKTYRAIVDLGLLDVETNHIRLVKDDMKIVGASSDLSVIDLGENSRNYKVGDLIEFRMDYMGMLRIMNSKYIEKRVV
ncbi:MAG: alanine racemase [Bacteroidales bacterium]|jgi:predicted amino acid racemase|nr:alanine racemase [Bacteroidales bacterium]MCI2122119.1 alanine racemase [Bacteroidales bacterium]MCI2145630.1 alanine racemase [Bacteroidales bacterium]